MTTDLLEPDAGAPDPWEAGAEDEEEVYRCGCADCRTLRGAGRDAPRKERRGSEGAD